MTQQKNIPQIMNLLFNKYSSTNKTTLNRMRKKPDPFRILISCLLSLRARDENTEKVSKQLFKVADTPKGIVSLPLKKLEKLIFSSGHYKKKSRALQKVSKKLIDDFNSKVPDTYEELISIKHIGPKTAKIVLAFAFQKDFIPIDTHCHRIPNRIGWIKTKTAEQTDKEIPKILAKKYWKDFNTIFVQFGRDICNPISPKCSICPINKYCEKVGVVKSR
jgi:endonuclease III